MRSSNVLVTVTESEEGEELHMCFKDVDGPRSQQVHHQLPVVRYLLNQQYNVYIRDNKKYYNVLLVDHEMLIFALQETNGFSVEENCLVISSMW